MLSILKQQILKSVYREVAFSRMLETLSYPTFHDVYKTRKLKKNYWWKSFLNLFSYVCTVSGSIGKCNITYSYSLGIMYFLVRTAYRLGANCTLGYRITSKQSEKQSGEILGAIFIIIYTISFLDLNEMLPRYSGESHISLKYRFYSVVAYVPTACMLF